MDKLVLIVAISYLHNTFIINYCEISVIVGAFVPTCIGPVKEVTAGRGVRRADKGILLTLCYLIVYNFIVKTCVRFLSIQFYGVLRFT